MAPFINYLARLAFLAFSIGESQVKANEHLLTNSNQLPDFETANCILAYCKIARTFEDTFIANRYCTLPWINLCESPVCNFNIMHIKTQCCTLATSLYFYVTAYKDVYDGAVQFSSVQRKVYSFY
jgi:hypothetical protein